MSLNPLCPNLRGHEYRAVVAVNQAGFPIAWSNPPSACIASTPARLHPTLASNQPSTMPEGRHRRPSVYRQPIEWGNSLGEFHKRHWDYLSFPSLNRDWCIHPTKPWRGMKTRSQQRPGTVEGRTERSADNDQFILSVQRPTHIKAALRNPTVAVCRNKPDSSVRPAVSGGKISGTVRIEFAFRGLFRFSSRHYAWRQLHRRSRLGCSSTHCCRHYGNCFES